MNLQAKLPLNQALIQWNPNNKKQIDEAKKFYINARQQNRKVLDLQDNILSSFPLNSGAFKIGEAEIPDQHIFVSLINETGDERIMWNTADPAQIKEASERFQKYIEKGWKAYAVKKNGDRGLKIHSFNPSSEEVIFDDRTTKQRLSEFAKSFQRIKIVPKTYSG